MRTYYLFIPLTLLLAACAGQPAVVVVPATQVFVPAGDVLPVEAQRVIDRATATSAAVATADARATAGRLAIEQALSDDQARQALDAQQTQVALSVTVQIAGLTQIAAAAAVSSTQAARQTETWARPTAAALQTDVSLRQAGVVATATAISARARKAAASADTAVAVAGIIPLTLTLVLLALSAVTVYYFHQWQAVRLAINSEVYRELQWTRVDQAQAATAQARAAAIRESTVMHEGKPYLITATGWVPLLPGPGGLPAVSVVNKGIEHRWRSAMKRAVYAGIALGEASNGRPQFGERDLVDRMAMVETGAGYRKLNKLLRQMTVWATSGRDTVFGPGWTEERFEREFDALPLPALPEGEPPYVKLSARRSVVPATPAAVAAGAD